MLFAQDTVSMLAGAGGWAGAGLLGLVLGWLLLKHLPAKDAQLDKLINDHANRTEKLVADHHNTTKELVARHDASVGVVRADFKESLNGITSHCEREVQSLANFIGKEVQAQSTKIDKLEIAVRDLQGKGAK